MEIPIPGSHCSRAHAYTPRERENLRQSPPARNHPRHQGAGKSARPTLLRRRVPGHEGLQRPHHPQRLQLRPGVLLPHAQRGRVRHLDQHPQQAVQGRRQGARQPHPRRGVQGAGAADHELAPLAAREQPPHRGQPDGQHCPEPKSGRRQRHARLQRPRCPLHITLHGGALAQPLRLLVLALLHGRLARVRSAGRGSVHREPALQEPAGNVHPPPHAHIPRAAPLQQAPLASHPHQRPRRVAHPRHQRLHHGRTGFCGLCHIGRADVREPQPGGLWHLRPVLLDDVSRVHLRRVDCGGGRHLAEDRRGGFHRRPLPRHLHRGRLLGPSARGRGGSAGQLQPRRELRAGADDRGGRAEQDERAGHIQGVRGEPPRPPPGGALALQDHGGPFPAD
mmetsp:Transcript_8570/g.18446  ORF Transcript_8570/g.18446 Transcript_8570/m.18446 type:complete len:393 (-) Transcript_8570:222-1400(-)